VYAISPNATEKTMINNVIKKVSIAMQFNVYLSSKRRLFGFRTLVLY
jgi:hypothetical protein